MTALVNGDQIFPEMLAAVRPAQQTITPETYIHWSGEVGAQFTAALIERARAGVKVHLLIDWFGFSRIDAAALRRMEEAGVESVRRMYLLSIAAAEKSIRRAAPYFVPGDLMVKGLLAARAPG